MHISKQLEDNLKEQPNIEFRIATVLDVNTYISLMEKVGSPTNLVEIGQEAVRKLIEDTEVLKIYNDQMFVGIISYVTRHDGSVYIVEFAIHPDHQGKGLGDATLSTLLEIIHKCGYHRVELITHPDNPALRLYLRHGLRQTGTIDDYEGSGTPRLVLGRELS